MSYRTTGRNGLATQTAYALTRLLTWGLPDHERDSALREAYADWDAMAADRSSMEIVWRAVRGLPAAVWIRLDNHDTTALPAGLALSALGLGGVAAGGLATPYPVALRSFIVVAGIGTLLLGLGLLAEPRRLATRRLGVAAVVTAAGFFGMAVSIPTNAGWAGMQLPTWSRLFDTALAFLFTALGIAFAFAAFVLVLDKTPKLARVAAGASSTCLGLFAVAGFAWAILVAPYDLAMTIPAIGASLAAASAAHVVPRLKHLEMM